VFSESKISLGGGWGGGGKGDKFIMLVGYPAVFKRKPKLQRRTKGNELRAVWGRFQRWTELGLEDELLSQRKGIV